MEVQTFNTTEYYSRVYLQRKEEITRDSSALVNACREEALESFLESGLPAGKDEKYKYTPVNSYFTTEIPQNFNPGSFDVDLEELFRCDIPELDTYVVLVLNGRFHSPSGINSGLPDGIIIDSLLRASHRYPELFSEHYSKYAIHKKDGVTALNTLFSRDGVFLYIPRGVVLDKPLQIIHLLLAGEPQMVHHRNLFILEENAEGKVLICDHTLSSHDFMTNSVTEIYAGKGSGFELTRVQNEHNQAVQITNAYIHQKENSRVHSEYITLHGGKVRNNLYVDLAGEGAENNSVGLFFADDQQHVDNFTCVNHLVPGCTSNQLYKGILDHNATGSFNGKIYVEKDAQHTQAYQRNNNILLSKSAKMHTRPQLEIYADDVKCSHGATVGQIDTDALFYLRSRGIPKKESMHLLMYAFAYAVLSQINLDPLRERVAELVEKRLRGELSRCNNCKMQCR